MPAVKHFHKGMEMDLFELYLEDFLHFVDMIPRLRLDAVILVGLDAGDAALLREAALSALRSRASAASLQEVLPVLEDLGPLAVRLAGIPPPDDSPWPPPQQHVPLAILPVRARQQ